MPEKINTDYKQRTWKFTLNFSKNARTLASLFTLKSSKKKFNLVPRAYLVEIDGKALGIRHVNDFQYVAFSGTCYTWKDRDLVWLAVLKNGDHSVLILPPVKGSDRTCHHFSSVSQDLSAAHKTLHQSSAKECEDDAARSTGSELTESTQPPSKLSENQKRKLKKKRHKERVRSNR